ncbi:hypothetical protein EI42_04230 [Thermosporothrix hazakensis]|jgi:hypothetical protein|uniref:Uncharacterized protein n=2 Tax=Thermosporothrix TaxID=768650 RepID=A0A326U342_THEHA|nr:hypothetical protein [Thermosporothrix hazakensis]PZW25386.1 hypothetical protein EI42_04230 [Thermosporothrix hazakensis]BBH90720.1 hypothetical protein KTC_54710 [Thermosporothrix sp. COM3]GCE48770.1 hypothetical protein KTH_36390 [Thermosporothrix hazakensis]
MSIQVLPQEDFFIFVPDHKTVARPALMPGVEGSVQGKDDENVLPASDCVNWIEIPLDKSLIVYAHMWEKEEA